jgi:hypothetical protein
LSRNLSSELPELGSFISVCLQLNLGFARRFLKQVEVSLEKTRMEQKDAYPEKSPVQANPNGAAVCWTYVGFESRLPAYEAYAADFKAPETEPL